MATTKTGRVVSFLLAVFLFLSSVGAVLLIFTQSDDSSSTDLSDTTSQSTEETCSVAAGVSSAGGPGDTLVLSSAVTELQVTDVREGTGEAVVLNDCVTVHYRLTLADGTVVSGNDTFATGQPVAFELVEGGLIQGWIKGLPGTKVGGLRRLVIPAAEAYGTAGSCAQYAEDNTTCSAFSIPPNADLVFDIEVLDTKH